MEAYKAVWEQLTSGKKLERDKGNIGLQRLMEALDPNDLTELINFVTVEATALATPQSVAEKRNCVPADYRQESQIIVEWEFHHAVLSAFKLLVMHPWSGDDFRNMVKQFCIKSLVHEEYRVRIAAGECLGALCNRDGAGIYIDTKDVILGGIKDNLERDALLSATTDVDEQVKESDFSVSASPRTNALLSDDRLSSQVEGHKYIFHDTAGWKNLETFMKCLQSVIDGCGSRFNNQINQQLLDLIFTALTHTNRFVRETGYQVCGSLVSCNTQVLDIEIHPETNEDSIYIFGRQLAEHLASGLADNWSQVRLAASQATRQFLVALDENSRADYMSLLLPRMCLNRYYVAEGVRIYSQDTWRRITGDHGKEMVEQHISSTVDFYISQSEADNHAVREAACACIAELGSKISKDCVRPYVSMLLDALKICFEDDSWPVRDAACIASGNFVRCFPDESKGYLPKLMPMFYENLQDNIPSVRSGAAQALASVAATYGEELSQEMVKVAEKALKAVDTQKANTDKYSGLEKGPATYSVVKKARDNDPAIHSDNTMYSCGSLAPKMGRGGVKDKGGCMNSTFRRPAEPWEQAEGCVHLLAELSGVAVLHQSVATLLPLIAQATANKDYTQHVVLLETVCKRLPEVSRNIGKRLFKPHLELFFDAIFYSLTCDNALTATAASQCLNHLSQFIGPNILRGRVEMYNPNFLSQLEANSTIAPM
ncbi:uncharacterized protein [Watersipora subatra]|uniref:uncharacterized protein n=1 Tax=Watersipora subatra TaxID=2589382 RepID=UPI00355C5581